MSAVLRVPVSPSPNYLNRVVVLQTSALLVGGDWANVPIELFVSPDRAQAPAKWVDHIASLGMSWTDVDANDFRQHRYAAATQRRIADPTDHSVIVLADADLILVGSLTDAVEQCRSDEVVLGVTAYRSPLTPKSYSRNATQSRRECWIDLYASLGLRPPEFTSTHPGGYEEAWDDDFSRCPTYFNFGMVLVPASAARGLAALFLDELAALRTVFDGAHDAQLAFSCAISRSDTAARELPLRYNFPNQTRYLEHYRADLDDLRVLHYMATGSFDKETDLDSASSIRQWLCDVPDDPLHGRLAAVLASSLPALEECPWNHG